MFCNNCGVNNDADAVFCMNCGKSLATSVVPNNQQNELPRSNLPPGGTYFNPRLDNPGKDPDKLAPLKQYVKNEGSTLFNVWNPFAGYGSQHNHQGWLMDNKGEKSSALIEKVRTKFKDRQIPATSSEEKELIAKGIIVEKRTYFLLTRRLVTIGLYITQFGKDLFVSIASYLKPPISNLRVLFVTIMAIFAMYTLFIFPRALENKLGGLSMGLFGGGGSMSGLANLLCIIGPLGTVNILVLGFLLILSGYKWFTERDFLAALRSKPNEFNNDDLMAMEKAVEQTVRIAMDEIGLDPDDLKLIKTGDDRRLI